MTVQLLPLRIPLYINTSAVSVAARRDAATRHYQNARYDRHADKLLLLVLLYTAHHSLALVYEPLLGLCTTSSGVMSVKHRQPQSAIAVSNSLRSSCNTRATPA
jgi:hypothetical protein